MWKRIKSWIINKFLPSWCRQECLDEIRHLREQNEAQATEIKRLRAYISGMQDALKRQPRIIVHGGKPNEHT
jgi:hypothetical protein|nr:MAG TPA: coiled coil protein [Bacteriophage sp.]